MLGAIFSSNGNGADKEENDNHEQELHLSLLHDNSIHHNVIGEDELIDEGIVINYVGEGDWPPTDRDKKHITDNKFQHAQQVDSDLLDPGIGFWDVYTTPLDDDDLMHLDDDIDTMDADDGDGTRTYISFNDMLSIQSAEDDDQPIPPHPKTRNPNKSRYRVSRQTRRRLKRCAYTLASIGIALTIVIIPILTYMSIRSQQYNENGTKKEDRGRVTLDTLFYSAAVFVLLASSLSVYEICCHLTHWYMPDVQKYVVRILWMVPIYAVDAWCSIRFHHFMSVVLEMVRGLYEAYVIAAFVYYLVELLGGERHACNVLRLKDPSYGVHYIPTWLQAMFDQQTQQEDERERLDREHPSTIIGGRGKIAIPTASANEDGATDAGESRLGVHPLCVKFQTRYQTFRTWLLHMLERMLQPWSMGEEFLYKTKYGVLQYVVLKVVATVAVVVLNLTGLYNSDHESNRDRRGLLQALEHGRMMVTLAENISVGLALYCLVKIYYATKADLTHPKNWHPAYKFLCVKGVVFFTFWQGVILSLVNAFGLIPSWGPNVSSSQVTSCLQDYIVCLEMLLFAMAHRFTFSYREYLPPRQQQSRRQRKRRRRRRRRETFRRDDDHDEDDRPQYRNPPYAGVEQEDQEEEETISKTTGRETEKCESETISTSSASSSWSFSIFPDVLSKSFTKDVKLAQEDNASMKKRVGPRHNKKSMGHSLLLRVEEEGEDVNSSQQSVGCSSCEEGDGGGGSSSISLASTQNSAMSTTSTASALAPPHNGNLKHLCAPMSARHALWSSVVPEETLSDIRRFSHGTKSLVAVAMASRQEQQQPPPQPSEHESTESEAL
jgi:hypothetical protein